MFETISIFEEKLRLLTIFILFWTYRYGTTRYILCRSFEPLL